MLGVGNLNERGHYENEQLDQNKIRWRFSMPNPEQLIFFGTLSKIGLN